MTFPFIFDTFNSHKQRSFCSNAAEGIKSTVVPEVHFAVLSATHHCKLHFSLLHLVMHIFHLPSSLFVIALPMFLHLSGKGERVKRKKARAPAEERCESHFVLCTSSIFVLWPLSSPQCALPFWAGGKSSFLQEQGAERFQG